MNFDLGISISFLTGVFLTTPAVALPETPIDASLAAQLAPAAGGWSNAYAAALAAQLPNGVSIQGDINYQRDAMRDFLAIYSVTRDNGAEASGWDDLIAQVATGTTQAQKTKILTALFGDGTTAGSIVSGAIVGGDPALDIKNAFANYHIANGSKQAALLRMGEVLNALGVPRSNSQSPNANTTYNLNTHFNHFHVNVKPPVLVDIETTANLLATEEASPIVLAAAPTSSATDAVTTSAPDSAATPATQYDAVYSVCGPMHSADQSTDDIERDNLVSPTRAVNSYFESRGILLNIATGLGKEPEKVLLKQLKGPSHGQLVARNATGIAFTYHADAGYLGVDQMVFEVEILGKKFKVIDTLVIHNSGNFEYPTKAAKELFDKYCPSDKGSSLDIIELPTNGFVSDEELAKLHSMVSFALGSGVVGNGGLSFVDLPGAAVGQTVGSTITLDTNAAGYNWFIDPTPGSNEEWLPTSNPNEWVAKAGSAAAGKMDMLSVLPCSAAVPKTPRNSSSMSG